MQTLGFFVAVAWEQHGQAIVLAGAVAGTLALLYRKAIKPALRWCRTIAKAAEAVRTQLLTNNGGSTLLDMIQAINQRTMSLEEWRTKQEGETP